ncbi:J domain-containing protein [Halosimplex pelagicum]|uniref:J domain-containing protein n=1 Tax=Halosimplex pelagicum TaxID=869886 RepID=UPI001C54E08B|nr:DnaJ domain-containing protein [Halosimplex pelagicum]
MNRTFYGVLGVGPDADEEAIRAAYRERVKEHHPDVSSEPDAADRFKRLTAAKETLLDAAERARYDRLGHRAYVSSHADSTLWATESSPDSSASSAHGSTTGAADSRGGAGDADDADDAAAGRRRTRDSGVGRRRTRDGTDRSSRGSSGTWAGRTEANRRSSSDRGSRRGTGGRTRTDGARRSKSSRSTGSGVGPGSSDSTGPGDSEAPNGGERSASGEPSNGDGAPSGDDTETGGSGATASETAKSGTESGRAKSGTARAGVADRGTDSGGRRRRRASGGTATDGTRRGRSSGSYATTSFWGVTEDRPSPGRSSRSVTRRALAALRRLGPWVLVHALFLSLAVGTGWYVYTVVLPPAERSVALLFVLIGEVGVAVVLSSLHILSRLYR